jgi:hypothetical protein
MPHLTVLVAHERLVERTGAELYAVEVAEGLLARGHRPVLFAPRLGALADAARAATLPVVNDLTRVDFVPDVVHGQSNRALLACLLRFPGVPAVRVCHGAREEPAEPFPGIARFVCVDDAVRDRAVLEWGLPESRTEVLLNFVDLARFAPRPPLPERPRRALVFANNAAGHLPIVRAACEPRAIEVEALGLSTANASDVPEAHLREADLVFAKARCALEALATGAAVVLCDAVGSGPLVTTANVGDLRRLNFGLRALSEPLAAEALGREIDRYRADDAAEVSARVRREASAGVAIDRLVEVYERAVAHARPVPPEELMHAAAAYLQRLGARPGLEDGAVGRAYQAVRSAYFFGLRVPGVRRLLADRGPVWRLQRWLRGA